MNNTPNQSVYYAPLSNGKFWRHPDHSLVKQAALKLLILGKKVYFYPDIPYARLPDRNKLNVPRIEKYNSKKLSINFKTKIIPLTTEDIYRKVKDVKSYKSQYTMTNLVSLNNLARSLSLDYELIFKAKF